MKIPDVHEALLDSETLSTLMHDIDTRTQLVEVMVRGAASRHAVAVQPTLEDAIKHLRDNTCRGVQLRYDYQGLSWCDTLIPGQDGVRLVRIAHDWEAFQTEKEEEESCA